MGQNPELSAPRSRMALSTMVALAVGFVTIGVQVLAFVIWLTTLSNRVGQTEKDFAAVRMEVGSDASNKIKELRSDVSTLALNAAADRIKIATIEANAERDRRQQWWDSNNRTRNAPTLRPSP